MTAPAHAVDVAELLRRAEQARLAGDYRGGCDLARQAGERAAALGDVAGQAKALRSQATQLLRLGGQEESVTRARDAVALLEQLGDEAAICDVLTVEAMALNELGMHEEALTALTRGRDIAHRLGDRDLLFWVHNRTGVVQSSMGEYELSTTYMLNALHLVSGMDAEARFCILNNLSDNAIHQVTRQLAEHDQERAAVTLKAALDHVDQALELARASGNPFRVAISLDNSGMLRALNGDFAAAHRMIADARAIAVANGYDSIELGSLQHEARLHLLRGDHDAAIDLLRQALAHAVVAGEAPVAQLVHRDLSEAYEIIGEYASALKHYRAFHDLERSAHSDVAAVRARMAVHQFELDNARLETELARIRSAELEQATLSWQRQAVEDALTGLPNRRHAEQRLPEMAAAGPLWLAVADIDHFKAVNDRYGHLSGDLVLSRIAAELLAGVPDTDLVARMGGEEFLIALHAADKFDAEARCEMLRARVAALTWPELDPGPSITVSIGIAEVCVEGDLTAATARADRNLYRAKRAGRNRVVS
ncbi:diguanylate cyclase domain-containing protein [Actinoplanes sp. NPDC049265]|uniref:diguanylate cyclase domain-containing protein n=1 Tax=Actinoplanes sp. NPDC049265 TaxID=3363902 RepID=UPI0037196181